MGLVDQIVHLVETRAVRVGALLLTKTPLRDASATPPLSGRLASWPCCAVKKRTGLPASAKARLVRGPSHGGSMLTAVSWSAGWPVDKTAGRALSCSLAFRLLLPDRPPLTCTLGDHRIAASGQSTVRVWTVLESQTAGGSRSRCASHGAACYRRRHCQAVPRCSGMVHA